MAETLLEFRRRFDGAALIEKASRRGITPVEIARRVGVAPATVYSWPKYKRQMTFATAIRVRKFEEELDSMPEVRHE